MKTFLSSVKPVCFLLAIIMVVSPLSAEVAYAQYVSTMSYYEEEEGSVVLGILALIGLIVGVRALFKSGEKARAEAAAKLAEDIERYFAENPQRIDYKEAVLGKKVRIGMNATEARFAWGEPSSINRTVNTWGVSEQWVYRTGSYNASYLYFDNGRLTTIQN